MSTEPKLFLIFLSILVLSSILIWIVQYAARSAKQSLNPYPTIFDKMLPLAHTTRFSTFTPEEINVLYRALYLYNEAATQLIARDPDLVTRLLQSTLQHLIAEIGQTSRSSTPLDRPHKPC